MEYDGIKYAGLPVAVWMTVITLYQNVIRPP